MAHKTGPENVRFNDCFRFRFDPRWVGSVHHHCDSYELTLVVDGELRTVFDQHRLRGGPGDALVYPCGMPHSPTNAGQAGLDILCLRWSGGNACADISQPRSRFDRNGRIRHQINWILDLYPTSNRADRRLLDCLTYAVVREFGRLQNPAGSHLAARVRRFVRNNIHRPISLDEVAEAVDLSKYHFSRKFKRNTGETPMAMVAQMRVDAARNLIQQTDMPLEAVARRVGLADASHLSHVFKRITGRTPGSYRRGLSGA